MAAQTDEQAGPRHRTVEIGVAVTTTVLGLITIIGSIQAGIGWGAEGPRAGFFPFYLGLFIISASLINLWQAIRSDRDALFAEWAQLRQVVSVIVPTAAYVVVLPIIGIYVSSALLIAGFMKWFGRYGWGLTLAVSLGVMIAAYLVFERWFLLPLPKGPLEELLGL
jgi:putative tricarboxylic transport membrane protein